MCCSPPKPEVMHFWQSENTELVVINRLALKHLRTALPKKFSGWVVETIEMNISNEMTPRKDLSRYLNKSVIVN